jgi:hypothetical protein
VSPPPSVLRLSIDSIAHITGCREKGWGGWKGWGESRSPADESSHRKEKGAATISHPNRQTDQWWRRARMCSRRSLALVLALSTCLAD